MGRPVIAYHIVFGAYGFWLPNDPRGSQSKYVFAPRLVPFGPPRPLKSDTTLSPADAEQLRAMQLELVRPPVRFEAAQTAAIADEFGDIIGKLSLVIYAAALMPDHVHVVAARQEMYAEDSPGTSSAPVRDASPKSACIRSATRYAAWAQRLTPASTAGKQSLPRLPSPWGEHGWKVFLFDLDEIEHAIEYVNANPAEAGLQPQRWPWVKPFEG